MIDGQSATLEKGIEVAAEVLAAARYPLIYGLSQSTCEAQQAAVALADWIGANIDTTTSLYHGLAGMTFSGVGEVTCTLGEVRHRGDLVIFWGTNPAETHPRHGERYSLWPEGMFVPRGRADRTCVVVDVRRSETVADADLFLQIKPGGDFEALWTLRALAQGIALDAERVAQDTGVPLSAWQDLLQRMQRAKFGVILFGHGLAMTRGRYVNGEAVLALTRDMNAHTRFVCVPMRGAGNIAGAENVLLWTTGFPFAVNMSQGYPRYNPGEFTANDLLARREVDAALLVGDDVTSGLSPAACAHLATLLRVCLTADESEFTRGARVVFRTAVAGIDGAGTIYRMDDVPLPARAAVESPYPSEAEILTRIEARVKALRGYGEVALQRENARLV